MQVTPISSVINSPGNELNDGFRYFEEQFEDIRILRFNLPGFKDLSVREKKYIYYLSQAALCGRDIVWDQNFRYNLLIRKTIETIIENYSGNRECSEFESFIVYSKRVFFSNGIHHHYSSEKFRPSFGKEYFIELMDSIPGERFPFFQGKSFAELKLFLVQLLFDEDLFSRKVDQTDGKDMLAGSSTNLYEGVSQKEAEEFYAAQTDSEDTEPVSIGLNSRLIKINNKLEEQIYRSGGKYGDSIDMIIHWLEKASDAAANDTIKEEIELLISFYRTGDLRTWDKYNISWVRNTESLVDYVNGFIETYEDPLGMKANWEAIVNFKDIPASLRTARITAIAQWFEDNSPIDQKYKKDTVTGVSARVINIVMLGGDCYPASPLGINLPNSSWIRKEYGSKSVTLANITNAYDMASRGNGFMEEFSESREELERYLKYGTLSDSIHTDLHECIGHAAGKLAQGTYPNSLKNYASPLEEARADLFALYYMADNKMIELGLFPDEEAGKAGYDAYIRNGLLTQLVRIKQGKVIEQAHMRCRSAITHYVFERGKNENVVELRKCEGKTYVRINDYKKLRILFGDLLREIQRIKSEGDYEAGRSFIENYGVNIDQNLHAEILNRYSKLNLAPFTGFLNPTLIPVPDKDGKIIDVRVEYTNDFLGQMIFYGKNFSFQSVAS